MTPARRKWHGQTVPSGEAQAPRFVLSRGEWWLLLLLALLIVVGLVCIYNATYYLAYQAYEDAAYFVRRQAAAAALGLLGLAALWRMDRRRLQRLSIPLMLAGVLSLVAVLLFGEERLGAQRSFYNGSFQPSELVKPIVILYLATWLPTKGDRLREWGRGFVPFLMVLGATVIPIFLQPDLGTGLVIVLIATSMFWVSGATPGQVVLGLALGALAFGVLVWVHPHAMARLADYLQTLRHPDGPVGHLGAVWQAIRSGGVFGRGPGASLWTLSGQIPLPHSDSAFAVIGETFGFAGLVGVILLLTGWVALGMGVAWKAPDLFGRLLALGVVQWIAWQALINLGGLMGVIPFTGIPSPFISYGGSALLSELLGVGLLLNVARGQGDADLDRRGRNWRAHLPGTGRRGSAAGR